MAARKQARRARHVGRARDVRTPRDGRNPRPVRHPRYVRHARHAVSALLVGALLTVAGGCGSGGGEDPPEKSPTPSGVPSGLPSAAQEERSPFTGKSVRQGPVIAVKFDNAPSARPHTGLRPADLVYVEKVEGGLSRLMAVYSGTLPDSLGPVRSARESDLKLLRQFGEPAFAYSGVRSALKGAVRKAPLHAVPPRTAPDAYFRRGGRPAPHNLFMRPERALEAAPGASGPQDIGFRFGPAPEGGETATHRTVRYPSARFDFDWSAGQKRWLVSMDGAPARTTTGARLGPPTVVVQRVTMRPSRFSDTTGAVTPYVETVGSGKATVLRDGKAYETTWKRPTAKDGTVFTRADGTRMPFGRGQVWIVYADR